tara:strand:+ start:86473 stop:87888 length:1416 start_codon:yes stop_codon:yes gene_type:complete
MKYDLIIIGGGAGGLTVASVASQLGLKTALIEKQEKLGGDCLHFGCVPSKTLIKAATIAHEMRHADKYGLTAHEPKIDLAKINQHVQSVIDQIQPHDDPERFRGYGCEVLFGEAKFINKKTIELNGEQLTAKRFVLATGSRPSAPPIPGLDSIDYLTNETLFQQQQLPKHLLILGAGVIGLEMAQAFNRFGCKVSVIDIVDRIMPMADEEVANLLQQHLINEGINFHFVSKINKVEQQDDIVFYCETKTGGDITIHGERLMIAAGRKANVDDLNLEAAKVEYSPRGVKANAKCQTTNKKIYAVGDVIDNPYKFTHMAEYEAGIVISNAIFKFPKKADHKVIPAVVFTDPEFAMVGVTEAQTKQWNLKAQVLRFPFKDVDRALAEIAPEGMVKLVIYKGKILGASILGLHAGELIAEIALAMQANLGIDKISATIHAYPTLAQINRRVVNTYYAPKLFSQRAKHIVKLLSKF